MNKKSPNTRRNATAAPVTEERAFRIVKIPGGDWRLDVLHLAGDEVVKRENGRENLQGVVLSELEDQILDEARR